MITEVTEIKPIVQPMLSVDEASVLVGHARSAGDLALADKLQAAIVFAVESMREAAVALEALAGQQSQQTFETVGGPVAIGDISGGTAALVGTQQQPMAIGGPVAVGDISGTVSLHGALATQVFATSGDNQIGETKVESEGGEL